MREPENPTYAYLDAFVEELARNGLSNVVICPGSRSTPLSYAFARNGKIKLWMQLDERSAGFFALGMAKAAGYPVALVCTSGTAAANFFPAVVEAHLSRVPLLVLTADRPPELREIGAPQAMDQLRLYGTYTRWFMEMALPEATNEMLRYVRTVAGRAIASALGRPAGVVHLNFPLREPLVPAPIPGQILPLPEKRDSVAWQGRPSNQPYVTGLRTGRGWPTNLSYNFSRWSRGLIICGPTSEYHLEYNQTIICLARQLGWPILADPLSGLRSLSTEEGFIIDNYDAFLRDAAVLEPLAPDFVLRFGAMPTSKPLLLFLAHSPQVETWLVDGGDGWEDPTALASQVLHVDPIAFCKMALLELQGFSPASNWSQRWQLVAQQTAAAINRQMAECQELSEAKVFAELSQLLPNNTLFYVGNSMPIRDADTFFKSNCRNIRVLGNRGANGIDGVVSSALGASAITPLPTMLILGDISFYHDMNGLLAAKRHKLNLTIILLNNDGGGIFSFLPQAAYPDNFEELFGTPHGLDFQHTAALYGANWRRVESWEDFRSAVQTATKTNGLNLIEVPTNRARNVSQHREIWVAVNQQLAILAPQLNVLAQAEKPKVIAAE
ncbi:MAG: 2-succinyl-5-enolpyruvyl-6-hydroxy-3-cyclohexene-1-carboxylic-acid synthase [Chloroflexota bacterium]|nr:2-succinyl-5-enolpyruvyl-6-hydroxy-3-cyclohexene-1-carboxylic-acid synthase [Chloroflexota bacterium]